MHSLITNANLLGTCMQDKFNQAVEQYFPLIKSKIGNISAQISDEELEKHVLAAHKQLPMSARIVLQKKWLVSFCINNKQRLAGLATNDSE